MDAMIRFMDAAAEYALHQSHMLVANMCGFAGIVRTRYPAWPAKRDSALVQRMVTLYKGQTGKDAQVVAQHVGLEPSFSWIKTRRWTVFALAWISKAAIRRMNDGGWTAFPRWRICCSIISQPHKAAQDKAPANSVFQFWCGKYVLWRRGKMLPAKRPHRR